MVIATNAAARKLNFSVREFCRSSKRPEALVRQDLMGMVNSRLIETAPALAPLDADFMIVSLLEPKLTVESFIWLMSKEV